MAYARPVTVNLQVTSDVSQGVVILASAADTAGNPVVCAVTMPVTSLYTDLSNAVFEIWEPSGARGELHAKVANGAYDVALKATDLSANLHACLTGSQDASGAIPFSSYKSDPEYYKFASVGELALAYAATSLFGHPAATAAISNDTTIVGNVNARAPTANAEDIATDLTNKILSLPDATAKAIANVVIGQDSARARDEDNNKLQVDQHMALKFYAGDKIIVTVNLTGWSSAGTGQQYLGNVSPIPARTFDYIITLAA